jgi:hypothetical protein
VSKLFHAIEVSRICPVLLLLVSVTFAGWTEPVAADEGASSALRRPPSEDRVAPEPPLEARSAPRFDAEVFQACQTLVEELFAMCRDSAAETGRDCGEAYRSGLDDCQILALQSP